MVSCRPLISMSREEVLARPTQNTSSTLSDFGNPGRSNYYGLRPSPANFIAPGKRVSACRFEKGLVVSLSPPTGQPLSSMSPTMVFQTEETPNKNNLGKLVLVLGGSGGPKIITAVLQVIINFCFLGMSLFEAMARPRVQ